jgi:hypothetical protein
MTGGFLPPPWSIEDVTQACTWPGTIACDTDGHVQTVAIANSSWYINSTIPAALGLLPGLEILRLYAGGFFGTIPRELFTPKLKTLLLNDNCLSGAVRNRLFLLFLSFDTNYILLYRL